MATIDWPQTRAFVPRAITFGVESAKSRWQGAFTNNREVVSHLASRLVCTMTLASVVAEAEADERASFLLSLESSGDWVRFGPIHRLMNRGTLAGVPTLAAPVSAGATSVSLAGVRHARNLLTYAQNFEGAAWTGAALVTSNTHARPNSASITADTLQDASASSSQFRRQTVEIASSTNAYTASVYLRKTSGGVAPTVRLLLSLVGATTASEAIIVDTDAGTVLSGSGAVVSAATDWWRISTTVADNASGNQQAQVTVYPAWGNFGSTANNTAVTGAAVLWGAQLELGATASGFSDFPTLLAGDMLELGGNLLVVSPAGATGLSTGFMTVPLALPAPADASADAVVIAEGPKGVWELSTDGILLDYSRGSVQQGISLPFRQVAI